MIEPFREGRASARLVVAAQLVAILAAGCAKPMPPPGGPVDTTPPRVVRTLPADRTTHQDTLRAVHVEFSESMDRRSVRGNTLISPSPGPVQWEWSGREARILFAQPLAPVTTYTVTLASTMTDLKANHLTQAAAVRFSTGAALDSGSVHGTVGGRRTRGPGLYVLLRRDSTTLAEAARLVVRAQTGQDATGPLAGASLAELGDFVTPVDPSGGFAFDGLPDGGFTIAAFADRNGNRAFDPDRDLLGVACDPVSVRGGEPVAAIQLWVGDSDERPTLRGTVTDSAWAAARAARDSTAADSLRRTPLWVLLDGDSARTVRVDSLGVFRVADVAPGRYRVRAFRDLDGDSAWTAGHEPATDSVVVCLGWGADVAGVSLGFPPPRVQPVVPPPEPPPVPPAPKRRPRRTR